MTDGPSISPREQAVVLELDGAARYRYFIKRVADRESAWSLRDRAGWVSVGAVDGAPLLPLWPGREYAELHRHGWEGTVAAAIALGDLFVLLADLEANGLGVSVFPTPALAAVHVSAQRLADDLRSECEEWY